MTTYLYIVFGQLLILTGAMAHLAAIRKYGRANRSCLGFLGCITFWTLTHFVAKLQADRDAASLVHHIMSPFWLLSGVFFFRFCEIFSNQDFPFWRRLFRITAGCAAFAGAFTPWIIKGAVDSRFGWVDDPEPVVQAVVVSFVAYLPILFGLGMLFGARVQSTSREMRKDFAIILWGMAVGLLGNTATDLAQPLFGIFKNIPPLGMFFGGIIAFFVYAGAVHRSFREFAMIHAAYDLFEELPVALLICDSQGEILRGNDKAHLLLRCRPEELNGRLLDQVIPHYGELSRNEPVRLFDRDDCYVIISETQHIEGGVHAGRVVMLHDLSERVRAERALSELNLELENRVEARTAELRLANESLTEEMQARQTLQDELIRNERLAAVGTLAGGVAHVFNNINTSVLGYAQLCQGQKGLGAETGRFLEKIAGAAVRARKVTEGLLTFSGMRRGVLSEADLNTVIRGVTESLWGASNAEECNFTWSLDLADLPALSVDTEEMAEVVRHLCTNAEHSLLGCKDREIILRTQVAQEHVVLTVTDSGCGIPAEDINRVFTPFFTRKGENALDDGVQSEIKGNGLGLSSCQAIVQHYGGELTLQSREGRGTTVRVSLPLKAPDEQAALTDGCSLAGRAVKRVVILDDEMDILILLESFLSKQGMEVRTFQEGPEAWSSLQGWKPDLVILDLQMPALSGMDFLERLHREGKAADLAVIVITGRLIGVDAERIRTLGAQALLRKPFELPELLTEIRKIESRPA